MQSFIFLLALLILVVTISKCCNDQGERSRVFVLREDGVVRRPVSRFGKPHSFLPRAGQVSPVQGWQVPCSLQPRGVVLSWGAWLWWGQHLHYRACVIL